MSIQKIKSLIQAYDAWNQRIELSLITRSLSFATMFSVIPLLALSLSVFKQVGGLEKYYALLKPQILEYLATGVQSGLLLHLERAMETLGGGALGITGFMGMAYASFSMLSDIEKAIARIFHHNPRRHFVRRYLIYLFFLFLLPIMVAVSIALMSMVDLQALAVFKKGGTIWVGFFITLFFAYWILPNQKMKPLLVAGGAATVSLIMLLAQKSFIWVNHSFLSYSKIYGSLAILPVFLLWIWLLWNIFILGAVWVNHLHLERE